MSTMWVFRIFAIRIFLLVTGILGGLQSPFFFVIGQIYILSMFAY